MAPPNYFYVSLCRWILKIVWIKIICLNDKVEHILFVPFYFKPIKICCFVHQSIFFQKIVYLRYSNFIIIFLLLTINALENMALSQFNFPVKSKNKKNCSRVDKCNCYCYSCFVKSWNKKLYNDKKNSDHRSENKISVGLKRSWWLEILLNS